ncbi:stage III sporulation protein AE [Metasolibacillus sp. FSL H7-0170]|uniref:stage III sporulation protein AE n=1 Tax=unclassified Metasolibacillus TaxID=2703679 RepID=UPI003159068D
MDTLINVFREPISNIIFLIAVVSLYTLVFLIIEAFVPSAKSWLESLFIILLVLTIGELVIEAFRIMREFAEILSAFFLALIPVLTSAMIVLQSILAFVAWSPLVLFLLQMLMHITNKVMIPALLAALLFDFCSRFVQGISFKKLADLLRMTSMSLIAASSLALSLILTISGVAFFAVDSSVTTPLKKVVEQAIPLVGSIVVQGFSMFQKFQGTATTITGFTMISAFSVASFYPAGTLLLYAFSCKLLAAITEPFTSSNVSGLIDDIGNTLFVLCAIAILLAITFIFIWLLLFVIMQLGVGKNL